MYEIAFEPLNFGHYVLKGLYLPHGSFYIDTQIKERLILFHIECRSTEPSTVSSMLIVSQCCLCDISLYGIRVIEKKQHRHPFSSSSGHHSLCIQSMDGMLMFFEQDSYSFGRFLPGFLLPGPLIYNPRTDSFLTVSSARQLESYK